jgi:hypothetical protein
MYSLTFKMFYRRMLHIGRGAFAIKNMRMAVEVLMPILENIASTASLVCWSILAVTIGMAAPVKKC